MKQYLLFSLFVIFVAGLPAQNWQPFMAQDVYNYAFSGNLLIAETFVCDSVKDIGGDSLFYFQPHIKCLNCNTTQPEIYVKNQPHFLGRRMWKKPNGEYQFEDTASFSLFPSLGLNATWQFNATLTASIISIDTSTLWGNTDSTKTIILSNADTILLSKNHGILRFPSFSDTLLTYQLIGIQTRNLGVKAPASPIFTTFK